VQQSLQVAGQGGVGVEAEDGVGLGELLRQLLPIALGQAPDRDDLAGAMGAVLEVGRLQQRVDAVLLRRLHEATRVDQRDVGVGGIGHEGPAIGGQPAGQLFGVDLVARAAKRDERDASAGSRLDHAATLDGCGCMNSVPTWRSSGHPADV
jgi:hypothetical protein